MNPSLTVKARKARQHKALRAQEIAQYSDQWKDCLIELRDL